MKFNWKSLFNMHSITMWTVFLQYLVSKLIFIEQIQLLVTRKIKYR